MRQFAASDMTNNKQIKKQLPKEGELVDSPQDNGHLINQVIVQILIEKDHPEKVMELMNAELAYNKERLQIVREHAEKHPDAIEERSAKKFRRIQYGFLMVFLPALLVVIYFMPTAIAIALCAIAMIIVAGIVLNGRDRDNDSDVLLKIIEKTIKRQP